MIGGVSSTPFDAPLEEFHSKKVMNKLIQQIHDPVVLASGAMPEWTHQLTTASPFLFPFEARELFFQCTAFGTSRSVIASMSMASYIPEIVFPDSTVGSCTAVNTCGC